MALIHPWNTYFLNILSLSSIFYSQDKKNCFKFCVFLCTIDRLNVNTILFFFCCRCCSLTLTLPTSKERKRQSNRYESSTISCMRNTSVFRLCDFQSIAVRMEYETTGSQFHNNQIQLYFQFKFNKPFFTFVLSDLWNNLLIHLARRRTFVSILFSIAGLCVTCKREINKILACSQFPLNHSINPVQLNKSFDYCYFISNISTTMSS